MATSRVVYLLDVDNTLLDNDRVTADLKTFLEALSGKVIGYGRLVGIYERW